MLISSSLKLGKRERSFNKLDKENSTKNKIRIMVVDDHLIVKQGLIEIISSDTNMEVMATADNGEEAIGKAKMLKPDIILLDIDMPVMNGIEAAYIIKEESPNTEIIILSMCEDEKNIFEAIKAGATGYLLKNISREELLNSIKLAYLGKSLISPTVARKLIDKFVYMIGEEDKDSIEKSLISLREQEVLELVAKGKSNLEISKLLFISDKTVKAHMRAIFKKLEVKDRAHAVYTAVRKGIF